MKTKRKNTKAPTTDVCLLCGGNIRGIWQNNGWDGLEGQRMDEITGYECENCGRVE